MDITIDLKYPTIITLILSLLKLSDVINLPWLIITAPVWLCLCAFFFFYLIMVLEKHLYD